ncbi:MAG: hypothetical protein V7672_06460 [Brevundimonas sp.]|uniref:hypothetical protein n=1 Tax=Brevundimonas sp. TaxID=1871086 RepID=UPI0030029160
MFLAEELQRQGETIAIPTPALSELLVLAGDAGPALLAAVHKSARFKIVEFDVRAAVEVAAMTREAERAGDKRAGSFEPYQKIKVDRQIVAIARVTGVNVIYSDDGNLRSFAERLGMTVVRSWELPLPPATAPDLLSFIDAQSANPRDTGE